MVILIECNYGMEGRLPGYHIGSFGNGIVDYLSCFSLLQSENKPSTNGYGTSPHGQKKDNDKKNVLAVQSLRNSIMASTLMASTSTVLSTGLAAFIASTYNVKRPLQKYIYGAHDGFSVSAKYISLLACFLFSFICYMQSVRFFNHVNYLINIPLDDNTLGITADYVAHVLARGCTFFTVGGRGFYFAFPLLVWIFGSIPVVVCSSILVPFLYHLDIVNDSVRGGKYRETCCADKGLSRGPNANDLELSA